MRDRSFLRQETSRTACVSNHLVPPLIHMITGFTNVLFSTLSACYKVANIDRLTTGVAPKLDSCPRRWLRDLRGVYHFAGFASCFAARSCLPKWFERSPVAEHFCSPEHDFLNHATLWCLDHNPEWTDRTRKARESYWIRRLNTLRPYGINTGDQ